MQRCKGFEVAQYAGFTAVTKRSGIDGQRTWMDGRQNGHNDWVDQLDLGFVPCSF